MSVAAPTAEPPDIIFKPARARAAVVYAEAISMMQELVPTGKYGPVR